MECKDKVTGTTQNKMVWVGTCKTSGREERPFEKSRRKAWVQLDEMGDFLSINPYKMENLEEAKGEDSV